MKGTRVLSGLLAAISLPWFASSQERLPYEYSSDLTNFVTHPEIKVPILNVSVHHPQRHTPGYWFMTPFYRTKEPLVASASYYLPCQTGPAIYDSAGDLIWSGACIVQNNNTFDFRLTTIADEPYLSWMRQTDRRHPPSLLGMSEIFDLSYRNRTNIQAGKSAIRTDFHEFNHIGTGWNTLVVTETVKRLDVHEIGLPYPSYPVIVTGFQEIHARTGQVLFEWDPLSQVSIGETSLRPEDPKPDAEDSDAFDFMHMNSVDKNADGDYLISARHTDTIYKISGQDGRILWRFGGKASDFVLQGFNFSKQHDARFLKSNNTHTIISFVNNAASKYVQSASSSSALVVLLHTATIPMTATVLAQYDRPDKRLTRRMGNVQTLPDGARIVNWSEGGYVTEYSPDGDLVLEARFLTNRFSTYRVYKYNFTGTPAYPPTLKAFAYGAKGSEATTACYVSWNGATEVASWRFYAREGPNNVSLGEVPRRGFETEFMCPGYRKHVAVEALDEDGAVLGQADIATVPPRSWEVPAPTVGEYIESHDRFPAVLFPILAVILGFLAGIMTKPRLFGQPSGYSEIELKDDPEEVTSPRSSHS